jgi:ADP-heptose:LPS heptosyltransferase
MKDIGWWFRKPVKAAVAGLAAVQPTPYPDNPQRILVVRDGGFGDMILTVPILNTLRALAGPDVRIDLLVRRQVYQLSQGYHRVNRTYAKGGGLWSSIAAIRSMRRRQYQVVIDLVLSPSLSFAFWILGAAPGAHRVGGDKAEMRRMYHQHIDLPPRPSIHFVERLRRIAAPAIGETPLDDQVPWIEWPQSVSARIDSLLDDQVGHGDAHTADGAVVLVNLSAGLPKRVWPDDSYRELLRRLTDRYNDRVCRWLITASPAEHQRAVSLAVAINDAKITVLPVEQDFRVIAALAGRVDLVITPDTSILHAASAQGVPLVVFTVAENVISWAPWKVPSAIVSAAKGQPVSTIPVDDVEAAFDRMAEALSASSGTAGRE